MQASSSELTLLHHQGAQPPAAQSPPPTVEAAWLVLVLTVLTVLLSASAKSNPPSSLPLRQKDRAETGQLDIGTDTIQGHAGDVMRWRSRMKSSNVYSEKVGGALPSANLSRKTEELGKVQGLEDLTGPHLCCLHWPLWSSGVLKTCPAPSLALQWVEL